MDLPCYTGVHRYFNLAEAIKGIFITTYMLIHLSFILNICVKCGLGFWVFCIIKK